MLLQLVAAFGLCAVGVLAAPTLRGINDSDGVAIAAAAGAGDAVEKPLVRTKRADEIIFDSQSNADSSRVKKSDPDLDLPIADLMTDNAAKTSTGNAAAAAAADSQTPDEETKKQAAAAAEASKQPSEAEQPEAEVTGAADGEQMADSMETVENAGFADANDVNTDAEETAAAAAERRRRRSAATLMVAENMHGATSGGIEQQQKLRAKRDLNADELRELLDAAEERVVPSSEYVDYVDQSPPVDYDSPADDAEVPEEEFEDENEEAAEPESWPYRELGRPKRAHRRYDGIVNDDSSSLDKVFVEEAEREAVRELLAERAAEEAREALLAYLVSGRPQPSYDDDDSEENDDGLTAYGPEDEEEEVDEDGNFDPEFGRNVELLPAGGSRAAADYDDEPEPAAAVEEKRFEYPYSYEPYGGRWGALVPGSKRSDPDPYDRLYRLAEALSGGGSSRSAVDDDEERK